MMRKHQSYIHGENKKNKEGKEEQDAGKFGPGERILLSLNNNYKAYLIAAIYN